MANVFDSFKLKTKKVKIEALGGKEVEITEMTVAQSTKFYNDVVTGYDENGTPVIKYTAIPEVNVEKVASCLVSPKMTVDELKSLSSKASEAITEIANAIDKFGEELKN